jgi:hypothetical protein
LCRNRTTRQRRFIRPASFLGLSFLLERRGGIRILVRREDHRGVRFPFAGRLVLGGTEASRVLGAKED